MVSGRVADYRHKELGRVVTTGLGFSAEEFGQMTQRQKIRTCRLLARRAEELAAMSIDPQRGMYLQIAKGWIALAEELELHG
jgi:hypothetical protein